MNGSIDQLGERLRELPVDVPRPDVITARVLTGAARPAPARPPEFLAVAAAFLVLVLASWGVLYFSPAAAAALADATGPGGFSGPILAPFAVAPVNCTAENSAATSSGYKLWLGRAVP